MNKLKNDLSLDFLSNNLALIEGENLRQKTLKLETQAFNLPTVTEDPLEKVAQSALNQLQKMIAYDYATIIQFDLETGMGTVIGTDIRKEYNLEQHLETIDSPFPLQILFPGSKTWQNQVKLSKFFKVSNSSPFIQTLQKGGIKEVVSILILAGDEPLNPKTSFKVLGTIILATKTSNSLTPANLNCVTPIMQMLALAMEQTSVLPSFQSDNCKIKLQQTQPDRIEINFTQRLSLQWDQLYQSPVQELRKTLIQYIQKKLNLKSVLDQTVATARKMLKADRVIIYKMTSAQNSCVIAESLTNNTQSMLGFIVHEPCITRNHFLQGYKQGDILAIEDIRAANLDSDHIEFLDFFNVKSLLVIPLVDNNSMFLGLKSEADRLLNRPNSQLWGLLVIHQCSHHRQWLTHDIEELRTLATQLESVIQQAKLVEGMQQFNAEFTTQIEVVNEQLQQAKAFEWMLKRIINKIHGNVDERQILQTVVQELIQILNLSAATSSVYNTEQTVAMICYSSVSQWQEEKPLPVLESLELYQQLFQQECYQFCPLIPKIADERVAVLVCPIVDCDVAIGDLWLYKPSEEGFCEWEIQLVELAASQCAIAFRQARLYEFAQAQVTQLAKLNQLKDDFLSTVSHELRTPLSNMKMALQMLAISLNQETEFFAEFSKPPESRSKVARYFQIVRNECEREIQLINDLLEFQQLDAESDDWIPMLVELDKLIDHVIEPFTEVIQKHQQTLDLEIPTDLPAIESDSQTLERILKELFTNASKYTPAQESIQVKVGCRQEHIFIQVTNTGVEIPPDELKQIFKKFYRIPKADPWQQGGTGLGLAVLEKLTERLGGTVQVSSENNQTCFTVELPIKRSSSYHLKIDDKSSQEIV